MGHDEMLEYAEENQNSNHAKKKEADQAAAAAKKQEADEAAAAANKAAAAKKKEADEAAAAVNKTEADQAAAAAKDARRAAYAAATGGRLSSLTANAKNSQDAKALRLAAKDEENATLWKYTSHTTPALPFFPLPPMFISTWSPSENCSYCNSNMHRTSDCMSKLQGFQFSGPDIFDHGARHRSHAGSGWAGLSTIGYGEVASMYFEVGISRLPHPARAEESGTFVEFRKSAHPDQASVLTVLVTPTAYMTLDVMSGCTKKMQRSQLGCTKPPASVRETLRKETSSCTARKGNARHTIAPTKREDCYHCSPS